jgi:phosphonate transport system substrate-binding protein
MYGYQWLAGQGLQQERDYRVRATRTDVGVGQLLLGAEATAAVMSNGELRQVPAELRQRLEVMTEIAQIPNFVVLAHPRLGSEQIASLRGRLMGFIADDDGGKFREATGVSAMQEARESQLKELDAYVSETRRLMGVAR